MKKNRKMLGLAAATLLAVAPVATSVVPVQADTAVNVGSAAGTGANTTNTTTQAPQINHISLITMKLLVKLLKVIL